MSGHVCADLDHHALAVMTDECGATGEPCNMLQYKPCAVFSYEWHACCCNGRRTTSRVEGVVGGVGAREVDGQAEDAE
eukprot:scaffold32791_cov17-Tisochrysis_lutea.AAC.1